MLFLKSIWPHCVTLNTLNNRFLRERGMVSNPKMEYQVLLCIFQKKSATATLCLKEMGNSFGKVGKKVCPTICFSLAKLNRDIHLGELFSLPPQRYFPISFKPKVSIAKFIGKIQKSLVLWKVPLFLLDDLLINTLLLFYEYIILILWVHYHSLN